MPDAEVTERPERWILTPAEHALVMGKNLPNRLGFAVLLLFFRDRGRFPRRATVVNSTTVAAVAEQLALDAPADFSLPSTGCTVERHRAEIRAHFGFREATHPEQPPASDVQGLFRTRLGRENDLPLSLFA